MDELEEVLASPGRSRLGFVVSTVLEEDLGR